MEHNNLNLTVKVWRQKNSKEKGGFKSYPVKDISTEMSFLGGAFTYQVHVQRWPTGRRVHVADALGHGPPVRWTGERIR